MVTPVTGVPLLYQGCDNPWLFARFLCAGLLLAAPPPPLSPLVLAGRLLAARLSLLFSSVRAGLLLAARSPLPSSTVPRHAGAPLAPLVARLDQIDPPSW